MERPTDASNTDGELILHMDQCYMASPPGIQVLFCLKLAFYDTTQSSCMMYLKFLFIDILLPHTLCSGLMNVLKVERVFLLIHILC